MYIEEKNPEQRLFSMALYMVAGTSGVLQFFESTVLLGLFLLLIAFFMAKAQRVTAGDTIYATHVEWTSRTLSTGTFVLFPAALVLSAYLIVKNSDFTSLREAMSSDDFGATISGIQAYITQNTTYISHITTITLAPPALWWVRRCVVGFLRAKASEPIDYPEAWI